ncbi:cation transporter [Flavobacterium terrae]|uniref:Heavy-metal-associated domain-containing protein n=1 Tax=Flavobacterium terrae TaxID=415425 RepID=A0A1M6BDT2_9FLAO|nr:heavy metal-associated domain-containing protein [Flavobacterium terrae]SHI46603.1 Heavy-metal-associated domain-containing protein [Flavobacterium terrae]
MKNSKLSILALVVAGITLVSCKKEESVSNTDTNAVAETTNKDSKAVAKAETTTFNIEGMTCAMGCAKTIENKLAGLDGVQKATVDFEKKTATVDYDAAVQTPEKLVETVEAVADGKTYKVSNVKNTADKAMNYQEPKQEKKKTTATKEASKTAEVSTTTKKKEGCCTSKKSCSSNVKVEGTL